MSFLRYAISVLHIQRNNRFVFVDDNYYWTTVLVRGVWYRFGWVVVVKIIRFIQSNPLFRSSLLREARAGLHLAKESSGTVLPKSHGSTFGINFCLNCFVCLVSNVRHVVLFLMWSVEKKGTTDCEREIVDSGKC